MTKNDKKELKNIKMAVSNGKLKITIDLAEYEKIMELSESGKSYVIASTRGNVEIESPEFAGMKLGVNLFMPKKVYDEKKLYERNKKEAKEALAELEKKESQDVNKRVDALEAKLDKLIALLSK